MHQRTGNDYPYREGYRRGAGQLAKYVCDEGRDQDFLVFPIVYLYRHHVELALKGILQQLAELAGRNWTTRASKTWNIIDSISCGPIANGS
jgi:hypothetical protein